MGANFYIDSFNKTNYIGLNIAGDGTWTCPAGVTSITVECWGSGAGGGSAKPNINGGVVAGGGGGSGAYAKSVVSVTPGNEYAYHVGAGGAKDADGEATTFNSTTVVAAGGKKGKYNNGQIGTPYAAGGLGGSVANSTGTVKYAGAAGASGYSDSFNYYSGHGGGAAGPLGAGDPDGYGFDWDRYIDILSIVHPGSTSEDTKAGAGAGSASITKPPYGYTSAPGIDCWWQLRNLPGGGASGGVSNALGSTANGGAGAPGLIIISYKL